MLTMKQERLRRGWNQTTLAYHARVPTPDVSRIETGRLRPTAAQLVKLAGALGLDPARLLDPVDTETTQRAVHGG